VLEDLVRELGELRRPANEGPVVEGLVARRMVEVTDWFADRFVTPMAAVAGAVADHVLSNAMDEDLSRLIVNNGGDIAFALRRGAETTVGVVISPSRGRLEGKITIHESSQVRGVATSGWRGRSFSLGVADAVTVLAKDAATADIAATVIASAVDLPTHPAVQRTPARRLDASSDLGDRLVTTNVGFLAERDRRRALAPGVDLANELIDQGVVVAVLLVVGETWVSIHAEAHDPFAVTMSLESSTLGASPPMLTPEGEHG
jgi:ApbE superfamily uncharacterized protein (UPF0280 family)